MTFNLHPLKQGKVKVKIPVKVKKKPLQSQVYYTFLPEVYREKQKETPSLLILRTQLSEIQGRDFIILGQRKTEGNQDNSDRAKQIMLVFEIPKT